MTDAEPGPWTFRFTASGSRLREAVDNYRALGFDVRTEPADDGGAGCGGCGTTTADGPVMAIFTRAADDGAGGWNDDVGDVG